MDDLEERKRKGGSFGNCGAGRWRANEDYNGKDDPEYRDEKETSPSSQ